MVRVAPEPRLPVLFLSARPRLRAFGRIFFFLHDDSAQRLHHPGSGVVALSLFSWWGEPNTRASPIIAEKNDACFLEGASELRKSIAVRVTPVLKTTDRICGDASPRREISYAPSQSCPSHPQLGPSDHAVHPQVDN